MDIGEWDAVLVGSLIGALIGALGAIGAQVVAQVAEARREKRRDERHRELVVEDRILARQEAQAQRFAERRLDEFADILRAIRHTEAAMRARTDVTGPRQVFEQWQASEDERIGVVQVVAPGVYLRMFGIATALASLYVTHESRSTGREPHMSESEVAQSISNATAQLREEMRTVLGIEGGEFIRLDAESGTLQWGADLD